MRTTFGMILWMAATAFGGGSSAQAAAPPSLAPFSAHYTADWRSINVGTSDLELRAGATAETFEYLWRTTARGIFRLLYGNDVIQRSRFTVRDGHVWPDTYRAEQGDATAGIDFDWTAGRATGIVEKKSVNLKLAPGTQDIMSIQIEVMLDLQNGNLPANFRILDKAEIKDFTYRLEGPARLRTAVGELDTLVVASQRTGNNRVLRMWFAPSLGYMPVQAERSRDGKLEFAMRIKSLAH